MAIDAFILNQLKTVEQDRKLTVLGSEAKIRCPWHANGQERNPSLGILLAPEKKWPAGVFHCFSCGVGGGWNKLAEKLGLIKLSKAGIREVSASAILDWAEATGEDSTLSSLSMPEWPSIDWRSIHCDTLRRYNARRTILGRESFLYLPVHFYGEERGGIRCRLDKVKGENSYLNTRGEWSSRYFFGFDQANEKSMRKQPLWVVEGPRDALNIAQFGGRVVALIGASNTKTKIRLIEDLDPPSVIIATDPDEAGDAAADAVRSVVGAYLPTKRLVFKKGTDPADLTRSQVTKIIKAMRKI